MESNRPHFKSADIDEKSIRKEKPEELALALAEAKADAIVLSLRTIEYEDEEQPTILIASDTAEAIMKRIPDDDIVGEDAVREKLSSVEEAREYIRSYSNGHAATVSSVVVTNLKTGSRKGGVDRVEIYFNEVPEEIIKKLIEKGMVLKVAGALLIEHPLILPLVKEVVGTTERDGSAQRID